MDRIQKNTGSEVASVGETNPGNAKYIMRKGGMDSDSSFLEKRRDCGFRPILSLYFRHLDEADALCRIKSDHRTEPFCPLFRRKGWTRKVMNPNGGGEDISHTVTLPFLGSTAKSKLRQFTTSVSNYRNVELVCTLWANILVIDCKPW